MRESCNCSKLPARDPRESLADLRRMLEEKQVTEKQVTEKQVTVAPTRDVNKARGHKAKARGHKAKARGHKAKARGHKAKAKAIALWP